MQKQLAFTEQLGVIPVNNVWIYSGEVKVMFFYLFGEVLNTDNGYVVICSYA